MWNPTLTRVYSLKDNEVGSDLSASALAVAMSHVNNKLESLKYACVCR